MPEMRDALDMKNIDLKAKYDEMHKEGPTAWTFSGWDERVLILSMMESWEGLNVLEVGCGEGDLAVMMAMRGAKVTAIDYSTEAFKKANKKFNVDNLVFECSRINDIRGTFDIVIMQGVLEHLDKPWEELKWMVDNLLHEAGAIITTSPGFLNERGVWWMWEKYVRGTKVSLTDLHEIHPWQIDDFAETHGLGGQRKDTDHDWASGKRFIIDLQKRAPAACKGRETGFSELGFRKFTDWHKKYVDYKENNEYCTGATIAYKLWR